MRDLMKKFYGSKYAFLSEPIALLIVVVFMLGFYSTNITGWGINDDEGSFLYQAWRVSEGDVLYRDFMSSHWPMFLYTGASWMRVFGMGSTPVRLLAAIMMTGTACFVYLLAREVASPQDALVSMVAFILHPQIFHYGRLYHPEPFYLFFGVAGIWLFTKGWFKEKKIYMVLAGLSFAVATLYKQLAFLFLAGVVLFLLVSWLRNSKERKLIFGFGLALLLPYISLVGSVIGFLILRIPSFYQNLIGAQFVQGSELSWRTTIFKNLIFLLYYIFTYSSLSLLSGAMILKGWFGKHKMALLAWQIPTALFFMIFKRDLFLRLLIYLVPSLVILAVVGIAVLRDIKQSYFYPLILTILFIPWVTTDVRLMTVVETDTQNVAEYVQEHLAVGQHLLADYQELGFYAQRPSTYLGSEISHVFTAGGVISAQDLITEMEQYDVKMVLLDVHGDHMASLIDYAEFRAYLQEHFSLLTVLPREWQSIEVYHRQ